MRAPTNSRHTPRMRVSSTPRLLDYSSSSLEYWIARSSRAMTTEGVARSCVTAMSVSFRGDAKHRATMCNCTSENLEIPGLVLRTIPE
jgi:hypothetical protein